jgi:hypothetical protein
MSITDVVQTRSLQCLQTFTRRQTMRSITHRTHVWAGLIASLGLVAFVTAVPASTHDGIDKLAYLTFSGPVALPGVALPAGQYTFEAIRADVVRVSSRDGRRVLFTGFTHRVPRPRGLDRQATVLFGEQASDGPPPITAWYPMAGDGHEFIYP